MALSVTNRTQTSFRVNWTSHGSTVNNYNIEIREGGTELVRNERGIGSTVRSFDFHNLTRGASFEVKLFSRTSAGVTVEIEYGYSSTMPQEPATPTNYRVTSVSTSSVSLSWSSAARASHYRIEVYRYGTSTLVWSSNNITSTSTTATGLTSGSYYDIKLFSINESGNSTPIWLYGVLVGNIRPANWNWSISKTKGLRYSVVNGQVTNLITYNELINFQDRINSFRNYKNLSSYNFSSRSRGQVYTAAISNQLKTAINEMNPPTSTGTSTNVIDNLNRLRDSLNSIQ